jgi:hypothetical protein
MLSWSLGGKKSCFINPAQIAQILIEKNIQNSTTVAKALFLDFIKIFEKLQSISETFSSFLQK